MSVRGLIVAICTVIVLAPSRKEEGLIQERPEPRPALLDRGEKLPELELTPAVYAAPVAADPCADLRSELIELKADLLVLQQRSDVYQSMIDNLYQENDEMRREIAKLSHRPEAHYIPQRQQAQAPVCYNGNCSTGNYVSQAPQGRGSRRVGPLRRLFN